MESKEVASVGMQTDETEDLELEQKVSDLEVEVLRARGEIALLKEQLAESERRTAEAEAEKARSAQEWESELNEHMECNSQLEEELKEAEAVIKAITEKWDEVKASVSDMPGAEQAAAAVASLTREPNSSDAPGGTELPQGDGATV